MDFTTNGSHKDDFHFQYTVQQPYLTREEWEFFCAALQTYIDRTRRADLMRVEAAEMLAAAMGNPYKRAKGKE